MHATIHPRRASWGEKTRLPLATGETGRSEEQSSLPTLDMLSAPVNSPARASWRGPSSWSDWSSIRRSRIPAPARRARPHCLDLVHEPVKFIQFLGIDRLRRLQATDQLAGAQLLDFVEQTPQVIQLGSRHRHFAGNVQGGSDDG